jgi:hypothetical protein
VRDLCLKMKCWHIKYRRKINLVICFGYCFIILLSVFHHHKYNFTYVKTIEESSNNKYGSLAWQYDSGIECIVHQNYVSLNTAIIISSFSGQIFKTPNYRLLTFNLDRSVFIDYQRINQLRAPPLFS